MNRRTFFAAVAPLIALAAPAAAQAPLGSAPAGAKKLTDSLKAEETPKEAADDQAGRRAKGPTEITADEASLNNREHIATFSGEVVVKDPEFNLTCDKLTAHLKKPKAKAANPAPGEPAAIGADPAANAGGKKDKDDAGGGIEKAIAEGNVVITQAKVDPNNGQMKQYMATAKKAVYESSTGKLTLYGWPKVSETVGGQVTNQVVALVESCVVTMTRDGNMSYSGGRANTTLPPRGSEEAKGPKGPRNDENR